MLTLSACQSFTTDQSVLPSSSGSLNQGVYSVDSLFSRNSYEAGTQSHVERRNFFSFDVRDACDATSVTLRLKRGGDDTGGTYRVFEVTTPAAVVNNPGGTPYSQATYNANHGPVFNDLGDGTSFGEFHWQADGEPTDILNFPLNAAGRAAFNAARGGYFTIGGIGTGLFVQDPSTTFPSRIFREVTDPAQLVVTCPDDW
jgi:hypothetical protein